MITKTIKNTRFKYEEPHDWEIRETVKNLWTEKMKLEGISDIDRQAMEQVLLFLNKDMDPPQVIKDISNKLLEDEVLGCFSIGEDALAGQLLAKCLFRNDPVQNVASEASKKAKAITGAEDAKSKLQEARNRLMAPNKN